MFNDAYKYYEMCGVEPTSVPITITLNYQMVIDRFMPLDTLPTVLYTMNMVNSALVPKLECLGIVINPYMGLML